MLFDHTLLHNYIYSMWATAVFRSDRTKAHCCIDMAYSYSITLVQGLTHLHILINFHYFLNPSQG